jgi:hypothetical protein
MAAVNDNDSSANESSGDYYVDSDRSDVSCNYDDSESESSDDDSSSYMNSDRSDISQFEQ